MRVGKKKRSSSPMATRRWEVTIGHIATSKHTKIGKAAVTVLRTEKGGIDEVTKRLLSED